MSKRMVTVSFFVDSELSDKEIKAFIRSEWNLANGQDKTQDGKTVKYSGFQVDVNA